MEGKQAAWRAVTNTDIGYFDANQANIAASYVINWIVMLAFILQSKGFLVLLSLTNTVIIILKRLSSFSATW